MQQKLGEYRRWQDAHAYLYGRLLLKEAISQFGYNHSLENMQKTKYGKPYFNDNSFTFNISHSGNYIVCIFSTDEQQNLGIDIEEIKPIVIDDFKSIFSEKEKKAINNYYDFYTFWTRKEALVKADGRGLQIPLNSIDTTSLSVLLDHKNYNLYQVNIDENYIIYVAASISLDKAMKYIYKHPTQVIM